MLEGKDDNKAGSRGAQKAKPPPAKKGAKDKGDQNPLDIEKENVQKEITKCKEIMEKYSSKLVKLREQRDRFTSISKKF